MNRQEMRKILLWMLTVVLVACTSDSSDEVQERTVERMPIHISIPAGDGFMTRAEGDPGAELEVFARPKYLYLYMVVEKNDVGQTKTVLYNKQELSTDENAWVLKTWGGSPTQTADDQIYEYSGVISVDLPSEINDSERGAIRIYAALTPVEFDMTDDAMRQPETDNDETEVQGLKVNFKADTDGSYDYLKDVYSSPKGYLIGGDYYGTAANPASANPSVSLMLYHVAAKVDVMWNVDQDKQKDVCLKKIEYRGLKKKDCLLFDPMGNDALGADPYQISFDLDKGTQWYGRHFLYTIPYNVGDKFPIEMHLWQDNDDTADGFEYNISVAFDDKDFWNQPFTPWVREDVLIKKKLKE